MHLTLLLELPADSTAPAVARRAVRRSLAGTSAPACPTDDLLLVVSELVTNALVHGSGPTCLQLLLGDGVVEVAVVDGAADGPRVLPPTRTAEGGRGMALVASLATTWGVEQQDHGKRVWARFRVRGGLATPA